MKGEQKTFGEWLKERNYADWEQLPIPPLKLPPKPLVKRILKPPEDRLVDDVRSDQR